MARFHTEKLSIEGKGLQCKLKIIEALVFLLPILIFYYLLYSNNISLTFTQSAILILTLMSVSGGLIILSRIFDGFSKVSNFVKKSDTYKSSSICLKDNTAEFHQMAVSFNNLMKNSTKTGDELRRKVFELFTIKKVVEVARSISNIEDLLNALLENAMSVSNAKIGSVLMFEAEKQRLRFLATKGLKSGPKIGAYVNINESFAKHVLSEKKPLLVQDIESDPRTKKANDPKYGPPSFITMPIFMGENLISVLNLSHKETKEAFDSNDEHILSIMIDEIGFAVENAYLHSTVEEHLRNLQERTLELAKANDKLQQEVTEHKRTEEALRQSEKMYRKVMEANPDPVVFYDMEGKVIYFNPAFTRVFGWTLQEHLGKKMNIFVPQENDPAAKTFIDYLLTQKSFSGIETSGCTKDGNIIPLSISGAVYRNGGSIPMGSVITLRNISDQKKITAQLQQAQKMEAIGTLAGGITHDFNNILSAIIGYTELAILDVPEESKSKSHLKEVQKAANRAKGLVNQILTFSRKNEQELIPVQISLILKEALKLIRASLPTTIEIHQHIDHEDGIVKADPTQIHQVLMNLCTNAAHSMRENDSGILDVSLRNISIVNSGLSIKESEKSEIGLDPGPYIQITIRDTGHGMSPEVMEKIFDPYFTTKKKGDGTGLGLAVVHGIMKNLGGTITVESEPGKGTTFHVYFSKVEKAKRGIDKAANEPLPNGHERILFIDDEYPIVDIGKQMLGTLGYEVMTKTDSVEALKIFKEQPYEFDLVITDMTMPNMTGEKLAKEIMRIRSDIPIILCTGFSEEISEEDAKKIGIREYTLKPLMMEDLAKTIRKVLGVNMAEQA